MSVRHRTQRGLLWMELPTRSSDSRALLICMRAPFARWIATAFTATGSEAARDLYGLLDDILGRLLAESGAK